MVSVSLTIIRSATRPKLATSLRIFRAPSSLLSLDTSVDFLPEANYRREARVSRSYLRKLLTAIEVIRKGASLLFKFYIANKELCLLSFS